MFQNSVRYVLSLDKCFVRVPRDAWKGQYWLSSETDPRYGFKGQYWVIDKSSRAHLIQKAWKKGLAIAFPHVMTATLTASRFVAYFTRAASRLVASFTRAASKIFFYFHSYLLHQGLLSTCLFHVPIFLQLLCLVLLFLAPTEVEL